MENQRGTTAQPAMAGDAVPGTAVTLPTKIDEQTQQGTAHPLVFTFKFSNRGGGRGGLRETISLTATLNPEILLMHSHTHVNLQGSTQPGDGAAVRRVIVGAPSWKEKVIGYAKKSRGIILQRVRVNSPPTFLFTLF